MSGLLLVLSGPSGVGKGTVAELLLQRNPNMKFSVSCTTRAIRSYRLTMLVIAALNAAMAALVWFWGVRLIPGRTLWDYVVSFGIFALLPLSAAAVSRLAASPAISGRHAFFKRI